MSASKKATHTVTHKKQYLRVDGKMQHVPFGSDIVLSSAEGQRLEKKGRVMKLGQKAVVDLTANAEESPEAEAGK